MYAKMLKERKDFRVMKFKRCMTRSRLSMLLWPTVDLMRPQVQTQFDVIEAEPETEALPSTAAAIPESLTESQPNATMIDEAVPALGTSNNTVDDIEVEPETQALPSTAAAVPESINESQPDATMIDEAVPPSGMSTNIGPLASADAVQIGPNDELCENIIGLIVPNSSHNMHTITPHSVLCHINFDANGNVLGIVPYQSSDPDPAFALNDTHDSHMSLTSPLNISLTSSLNSFIDAGCIDDVLDCEPSVVDTADEEPEPVEPLANGDHDGSSNDIPQPNEPSTHGDISVELSDGKDSTSNIVLEHEVLPRRRKIAKKGTADPSKWKRNAKALSWMHGEGRQPGNSSCSCCNGKLNA